MASFVFGVYLANILHEMGHAISILVQGGEVTGFSFHPFKSNYCYSTYVPNHILLYAGGALFGTLITLLFPVIAFRRHTVYLAPFVMSAAASLTISGKHMILTPFMKGVTDYTCLVDLGVPLALIVMIGAVCVVAGVLLRILFLPLFGVGVSVRLPRRIAVYELGVLPFYLANGIYIYIANGRPALIILKVISLPALAVFIEAILSKRLQERYSFFRTIAEGRPDNISLGYSWAMCAVITIVMIAV
jgi:hypothetical protein